LEEDRAFLLDSHRTWKRTQPTGVTRPPQPVVNPPFLLKIFFRLTGVARISAIRICVMPIFKKPIYQERISKALTCAVRIFTAPI
jgi:hypothetical protein